MKASTPIFIRLILFLAPVTWVISCAEKRPDDVLTRQEMVQVMEEIYIAEEKVNHLALPRDSAKRISALMTAKVFEKAAVSDTLFRKSLDYYMAHPNQMELIYTALVDTLQLREQRLPIRSDEP